MSYSFDINNFFDDLKTAALTNGATNPIEDENYKSIFNGEDDGINYETVYNQDGSILSQSITFDEDNDGKIDSALSISYCYDDSGNVISQTFDWDKDNNNKTDSSLTLDYNYTIEDYSEDESKSSKEILDELQEIEEQVVSDSLVSSGSINTNSSFEFLENLDENIKSKILLDENNEPYINIEPWSMDSSSDTLDTLGKIVSNIYGVDFWSGEGQEIFKALAKKNSDAIDINDPDTISQGVIYLVNLEDNNEEISSEIIDSETDEIKEENEVESEDIDEDNSNTGNELTSLNISQTTYDNSTKTTTTTVDTYQAGSEGLNFEKELTLVKNQNDVVIDVQCDDTTTTVISNDHTSAAKSTNTNVAGEQTSINKTKDGKITTTYQSSVTGDCFLLSAVNALSYSEAGQEIIKNALDYQDGYTVVHLTAGDVYITDLEVSDAKSSSQYSSGDSDMIIFELALEKVYDAVANDEDIACKSNIHQAKDYTSTIKGSSSIGDGGSPAEVLNYICAGGGNVARLAGGEKSMTDVLDKFMESDGENMAIVASNYGASDTEYEYVKDINGSTVKIAESHAYSVKNVDEDTVTIVNPWNSGVEIVLSKDVFLSTFESLSYITLS